MTKSEQRRIKRLIEHFGVSVNIPKGATYGEAKRIITQKRH